MPSINSVENFNFGVFGLNDVRTSIVTAVPTEADNLGIVSFTNPNNRSFVDVTNWSQDSSHGWFGGAPSILILDRIDFSNDSATASVRGPLSSARYKLAATGNSNYGWFGGGYVFGTFGTRSSTIDRIDFSNDSATALQRGPLSAPKILLAATGNSNYGWFGGGSNPAPATVSTVDRIDFSNDSSTASVRGPLSLDRTGPSATGNTNYGWFGGGQTLQYSSTVDRIDFSNDSSTASVRGPLGIARGYSKATGNTNYSWFGGGASPAGGPIVSVSTVERIDFSNDSSRASVRGPLSSVKDLHAATGNSNYGWFGGGSDSFSPVSTVERIDFSNDSSTASVRGPLSSTRTQHAATSGQAKSSSIRPLKGGNFGWFGGGKFPVFSTIDRVDFSNDSSTASIRGPLSATKYSLAATGNSNYGWFGGGKPTAPDQVTTVDRIDFSNDSATASIRGPLSSAKGYLTATANSNYGWFGGGKLGIPVTTVISTVDRIDFSNDSSIASVRGSLSSSRYFLYATGNSNYGWFGGGVINPFATVATVDRIDFSNDSSTASVRSPLSLERYGLAATGNSNYGWFGGGAAPTTARVDRIDFSNDSSTALVRGPLNSARRELAATGNSNYGWFGNGNNPALSTVDRIDFSNDSATASFRGLLSSARYRLAATSNTPVG